MAEIFDLDKARAARRARGTSPAEDTAVPPEAPITLGSRLNPLGEFGRTLYELASEIDDAHMKQLAVDTMTQALGTHTAGTVIENMQIIDQLGHTSDQQPDLKKPQLLHSEPKLSQP